LVAPAALGLLAPLAANAAEVNVNDVASYATPSAQVTTSQFSDVVPGDWAYTALVNLSESYGCVDNAYSKNLNSGKALTRFEAAALVNSCLDSGIASSDVSGETDRLTKEFGMEMAILKGRVDGLKKDSKEFNAGQFSEATSVSGEANFIVGSSSYDATCSGCDEALYSKYSFKVNTSTSFNGQDALIAKFETGNGTGSRLLTEGHKSGDGTINLSHLYYTRPFGDFLFAGGPLFEMDALVATTTSSYSNDGLFHGWWYSPNGYSNHPKYGAPGLAIAYTADNGLNAGISYIAADGADSSKGMLTKEGYDVATVSLGYDGDNWGGGLIYTQYEDPTALLSYIFQSVTAADLGNPVIYGVGAYWNVSENFDISAGVDFGDFDYSNWETATAWSIGADYDGIGPGTLSAGIATVPGYNTTTGKQDDAGMAYELYYDYPVSDGITIKPMVMVMDLDTSGSVNWISETIFAVETTFKF